MENANDYFLDRVQAGQELGRALKKFQRKETVVLGIPRGGVVVAKYLAEALNAPLDIVLSRKIGAPLNPEFALGAIGEDGHVFLNEEYARQAEADAAYIEKEKKLQMAEIERRRAIFRAVHPKIPLKDRIVILTDDGVATGATFQAALWSIRAEQPRKLIAAIPVGPRETVQKLRPHADELVCLRMPVMFYALSQFYLNFGQVDDQQVLEILKSYKPHPPEKIK